MKKGHLLLIIVLLIIVIGCIWFFIRKPDTPEAPIVETSVSAPIEKVMDRNNYYMVENCVNKFYTYYASVFENKNPEEEDVIKTYNLLDKQYISFKNITQENLTTVLPKINESVVNIYNMYVSKLNDNISLYIVEGILREERSKELSEFQIMIQIDLENGRFSVFLQDYIVTKYPNWSVENKLTIESLNGIEKNRNNSYVYEEISDKTYALELFDRYKEEALYNPELAYESLDAEYKSLKFETLEKFNNYVEKTLKTNTDAKIEKYLLTEKDGYTQYVCIDNYGYYYIFRLVGLMDYSIILDAYTVDLPEFLEKYNSASSVDRVGYNIQKCLEAINNKDYAYVYDKLDFQFKAVNYPTLENFEKDIKAKLFDRNVVKKVSSYSEGSTYAFKLTIADAEGTEKEQDMTIIMQLKEGTDFVMSLSFEK